MFYGMFQEEYNLTEEYSVERSLYSLGNCSWSTTLLILPALQPYSFVPSQSLFSLLILFLMHWYAASKVAKECYPLWCFFYAKINKCLGRSDSYDDFGLVLRQWQTPSLYIDYFQVLHFIFYMPVAITGMNKYNSYKFHLKTSIFWSCWMIFFSEQVR